MKFLSLVLLACSILAPAGFSQQNAADAPASREDVERYLQATHTRDMMKDTFATLAKTMHQMNHQAVEKNPNLPADAEQRLNKMTDSLFQDFPTEKFLDAMIPVYQKHFTKGDLEAISAFYSTPAGLKMLQEMPSLLSDVMKASTGFVQDMVAKANQQTQDEIAQMQKQNGKDSKAPAQASSN